MTSQAYTLPWTNPDLDVHPAPMPGWHRVAVVGLWTDAKKLRRDWPDAAVVGPLRTLRGIDLLVRSLLANPQIRVLVVTGRDLSPGQSVQKALEGLWTLTMSELNTMCREHGWPLNAMVGFLGNPNDGEGLILVHDGDAEKLGEGTEEGGPESPQKYALRMAPTKDRPGGAIFLPPPLPPENPELPAGLPGQRVTGRTLAEVWPKVLQEVLCFGDAVPTSYGGSRELLNLVSVVEDPRGSIGSLSDGSKHPVLGIFKADLDDYYTKSFMGKVPPEGVSYSYGSRLQGGDISHYTRPTAVGPDGSQWGGGQPVHHVDQTATVRQLLQSTPTTRAAYLSPWRPGEDAGKESGRPCLVGAWFRATGGPGRCYVCGQEATCEAREGAPAPWQPMCDTHCARDPEDGERREVVRTLNLSVQFRSHDLHGAYPLNLAACCLWLCEEAKVHGMEVGTVTCLSMSAHVYDHAAEAASEVVSKHVKAGAWSQDARSAWRVWKENVRAEQPDPEDPWAVLTAWHRCNAQPWLKAGERVCAARPYAKKGTKALGMRELHLPHLMRELDERTSSAWGPWVPASLEVTENLRKLVKAELADGLPPVPTPIIGHTFHAEAIDPDGTRVLQVFEAPTQGRLIKDIQASGLVTSVQHALWLGAEVGKL